MLFVYTGMSGVSIIFSAIKLPMEKGFMVGLLCLSLLGVEASLKKSLMVIFISQKFLLLV